MNHEKLRLFSLVSFLAGVILAIGWLIGLVTGLRMVEFWAGCSGTIGAVVGVEIGYKRRWINARWDRTLWIVPILTYITAGGVALYNELPGLLVAFIAVIGAGVGALLAKHLTEFFNYEPPPSIS